jgi:hypothetical protein
MKINKFILILFIFGIVVFSTIFNHKNSGAFDSISTFLSITIGFNITALSIIANSEFSKKLYSIESENDNSKSLLHELIELFRKSMRIFLTTIILILIYKFLPEKNAFCFEVVIKKYPISFCIILKSTIWCLTILSFYYFINCFNVFSNFVIKTAVIKK